MFTVYSQYNEWYRKDKKIMKKLALDVGDKTIGVAVSDALNITAQGVTTIERVGIRKDSGKVMDYIREFGCDTVVMTVRRPKKYTNSKRCSKIKCAAAAWQM